MSDGTPEDELPDAESEATSDDEQRGKDLRSENSEARDPGRGGLERHRSSIDECNATDPDLEVITPDEERQITSAEFQTMIATHTGPLPSVNDFAGYDDVLPGAADRIVQMAEKSIDAYHQTALADAEIQKATARSIDNRGLIERRQQGLFSAVAIIAPLGTLIMAWFDKPVPSVVALIVTAASAYMAYRTGKEGLQVNPVRHDGENDD